MNNPEYVKIGEKKYKINTDFRVAIECNVIAEDDTLGQYERALAIIYKLFGDEGIDNSEDYEKLLELGQRYLLCGKEKELDGESKEKPDMDFVQDMEYIEASFMSDYNIDLENIEMHWWKFFKLINGLSNSEMGNCCVLNNIRNLRNMDLNEVKDQKLREKIRKAQQKVALKKNQKPLTKDEIESIEEFNRLAGINREE